MAPVRIALLLIVLLFGSSPASSLEATSDRGRYLVSVAPVVEPIVVGEFQDWMIELVDADGRPVRGAAILVGGGMRSHGHGLPTQPRVIEQMRAGHYLVEGMRLSMAGDWTLALTIESAVGGDRVLFDFVVSMPESVTDSAIASLLLDVDWQPPASPSNRYADDPAAAGFGEALFFDTALSANGAVSCATCHQPRRFFADGRALGQGLGKAMRNTPTLIGASEHEWFYWDGRRDSLWSQALVPFEAADEMGSSRVAVVRRISSHPSYREQYEQIFGDFPVIDFERLPANAGPIGSPESRDAWFRLKRQDADAVNTVFANVGKALAAFQRTFATPISAFDVYARQTVKTKHTMAGAHHDQHRGKAVMSESARRGLSLFLDAEKTNCLRCHNGTWFTNKDFHNIGTGGFTGDTLDFGRVYGMQAAMRDEFNCLGRYSDAKPKDCRSLRYMNASSHVPLEGAFKVPTLRNLLHTAPYMHDGRYATLAEVIAHYRNPPDSGPPHELTPLDLSDAEAADLEAFLRALSADQSAGPVEAGP